MPKKKKEKYWDYGMPKGELGPFVWHVWFKGSGRAERFVAFDEEHIKHQCEDRTPIVIERVYEKEEIEKWEPLGPKGSVVNQPADYDTGFKLLKEWVDSIGGPPEDLRLKLRELFIDYEKPRQKTTRYSARKKARHKI